MDSLKPLASEGVQGGSTVQSESFEVDAKLTNANLRVEADALRVKPLVGQTGQGGQVDGEPVSVASANLDKVDKATLLPQDAVQRAVDQMATIDSVASFQAFYDRYQCGSEPQQQQLLVAFAAQVDFATQVRFYECWDQLEAPALEVKPEPMQNLTQAPSKPLKQNKWVYARLSQDGVETSVKVLSERINSITVHVPGAGSKTIHPSDVLRVSDYTGN